MHQDSDCNCIFVEFDLLTSLKLGLLVFELIVHWFVVLGPDLWIKFNELIQASVNPLTSQINFLMKPGVASHYPGTK